jgi:hypothetical protein
MTPPPCLFTSRDCDVTAGGKPTLYLLQIVSDLHTEHYATHTDRLIQGDSYIISYHLSTRQDINIVKIPVITSDAEAILTTSPQDTGIVNGPPMTAHRNEE